MRVSSIGRAGENGVLFACIVNDLHRAAGRSGVGAVMGSKNLKAVAVRGTKGSGVKDPRPSWPPPSRQEGPGRQRGHRPGPAEVRHPGADERDQRNGRPADAQPPRRAVRGGAQDFGRSHARKAAHRRQDASGHQRRLLRLHHRLRPHLARSTRPTSPSRTSRNTGAPPAASNTKPPGRWARPTASATWKPCSTPTCCATKTAWTRSPSAPPSARSWSCTTWAS
jgi:hypothetical protein